MTPDELDRRVKDIAEEARKQYVAQHGHHPSLSEVGIRLALEGWEKPDPLLLEARELIKSSLEPDRHKACNCRAKIDQGKWPKSEAHTMAALRRGYELGKEAAR